MEATATVLQLNVPSLVQVAQRHMDERKLSIAEFCTRIDINRSMWYQYSNGTYCKPSSVEDKLRPYLEEQGALESTTHLQEDTFIRHQPGARFYQSVDAKGVAAMCSLAQQHALLNVVVGKSGYGKTHTLKQYAGLPKVAYIECDDTMERRDLVDELEQTLGMNQGYGSVCKRTTRIINYLNNNPGWLIIVDEADKLISRSTHKKMEIIRKLFDKSKVGVIGIVLAGEPQLEPILNAYDERVSNRGNYIYRMRGLTKGEVSDYLSVLPVDRDARDVLIDRACGGRSGCFRLLDRTLTNVIRLMQAQDAQRISLELVNQASDMMIL